MVTVTDVAVFPVIVDAVPPKVTVAPDRFTPLMVTDWPPAVGPALGVILPIAGAATYVKPPVEVALPFVVVTVTSTTPAASSMLSASRA